MADVTVTALKVRPQPGAEIKRLKAAAVLAPGDSVYMKADGSVDKAQGNAAATVQAVGLVVSVPAGKLACAAGDTIDICTHGEVDGFTGLTPATLLYVSAATAGKLADTRPAAASYGWIMGKAWTATSIFIAPFTDQIAVL